MQRQATHLKISSDSWICVTLTLMHQFYAKNRKRSIPEWQANREGQETTKLLCGAYEQPSSCHTVLGCSHVTLIIFIRQHLFSRRRER